MPVAFTARCMRWKISREVRPYSGTTSSSEKARTFFLNASTPPAFTHLMPMARVASSVAPI